MTEVWFYHLQRRSLEDTLPMLLQKSLERGWRCVVQAGSEERVEALDAHLWSYDDQSFLPHGTVKDGHATEQPVYLTAGPENPNKAIVRFFVDGAVPAGVDGYQRTLFLFDGRDDDAVAEARAQWKTLKAAGHDISYWQQDDRGRWQNKAAQAS